MKKLSHIPKALLSISYWHFLKLLKNCVPDGWHTIFIGLDFLPSPQCREPVCKVCATSVSLNAISEHRNLKFSSSHLPML